MRCDTHCCSFSQQCSVTSLQLPRLSRPEEGPIYGRLQDPDGADRLFLAYQGVCQASFFSPDPVHLLTALSLRHSRSMLNDISTQFVAALASPYRVTKE